jgi:hypothetical protein
MSSFAGPADLPFFDLLSLVGKLRAGFGAMGFKAPAPVSIQFFIFPLGSSIIGQCTGL